MLGWNDKKDWTVYGTILMLLHIMNLNIVLNQKVKKNTCKTLKSTVSIINFLHIVYTQENTRGGKWVHYS